MLVCLSNEDILLVCLSKDDVLLVCLSNDDHRWFVVSVLVFVCVADDGDQRTGRCVYFDAFPGEI